MINLVYSKYTRTVCFYLRIALQNFYVHTFGVGVCSFPHLPFQNFEREILLMAASNLPVIKKGSKILSSFMLTLVNLKHVVQITVQH